MLAWFVHVNKGRNNPVLLAQEMHMDNTLVTTNKIITDTQSCVFIGGGVDNHIHAFMTRDSVTSWKVAVRVADKFLGYHNAIVDDYGTIVIV